MSLSFHTIDWILKEGTGHLVLNQPPSNYMNLEFFHEMLELKGTIENLTDTEAIIIYGKGRHYSSGADLDELLQEIAGRDDANDFIRTHYTAISFLESMPVPVISAIRGVCLGSAMELALFSHFRFCGEDAVFGLPETTFNLIPGIGGVQRFAGLSGNSRALDYILTGRTFDAQTALELGIVDTIWPKKEVVERSVEFGKQIPKSYHPGMKKVYLKRYRDMRG